MTKYTFTIEKTATGYSAYDDKHAVYTTGATIIDLKKNANEAVELHREGITKTNSYELTFEIDLQQFFDYYKMINAKHLASRIGMNESLLSQYVNGKKRPSKKQINRIIDGLNEIGRELIDISLV